MNMKTEVTALEIYTSLPVTDLNTESGRGTVSAIKFTHPSGEELIEIEIKEINIDGDDGYYATLTKENALYLADGIINIIKTIK